jgi:hypothetical protein
VTTEPVDADFHVAAWRAWQYSKGVAYRRARDKKAPPRCRGAAQIYRFLLKVDVPTELRLALLTAATCDQVLPSVQAVLVKYRPAIEAARAAAREGA